MATSFAIAHMTLVTLTSVCKLENDSRIPFLILYLSRPSTARFTTVPVVVAESSLVLWKYVHMKCLEIMGLRRDMCRNFKSGFMQLIRTKTKYLVLFRIDIISSDWSCNFMSSSWS
ncbi:hypothetical protein M758_6G030900 [Ceratodon purpureus]|nr:hypothetical protein M758_6G030900 [Ceratodon purpureus]